MEGQKPRRGKKRQREERQTDTHSNNDEGEGLEEFIGPDDEGSTQQIWEKERKPKKKKDEDEPKLPFTVNEKLQTARLIVILESAQLETAKVGNEYKLLNCDDHKTLLRKANKDIAYYRPDITHQCLLTLMDSPLNKAGRLQVYIHTNKNVLIEVNPRTRIPRTFARFSPLMVQLLHKLSIRASNGPERLLRVIKNPITDHLPTGCPKIGTSYKAEKCVRIHDFVKTLPQDQPVVFVIGGFAHGKVEVDYTEQEISYSEYPLSASLACGKLCDAFEAMWGIL